VRVLPASVSRLWFLYLTYIRPFVDCLRHCHRLQLKTPDRQQNAYAFTTCQNQLYTTPQLSEAIRKLSLQVCQYPLTIGSYRQVVAAIAKRYVKELIATATATADPAFRALAHQFGHDPTALNNNYGLDQSYPEKLQPELVASYERTSSCWHQWLQLADFERELLKPAVAVAVATEEGLVAGRGWPLIPKQLPVVAVAIAPEVGLVAGRGRPLLPKKRKHAEDHSQLRQPLGRLPNIQNSRTIQSSQVLDAIKTLTQYVQEMEQ